MKNLTVDCEKLMESLLQKLQQIECSESELLIRTNACLTLCVEHLDKLRAWVAGYKFPDTATEIHFFKKVKPAILSRIVYYRMVLDLHLDMCPASGHKEEQQLIDALHETTEYFRKNLPFYQYYRTRASEFDEALFVRGRSGVNFFRNSNYDVDPVFATGYDGELARFMAHEHFVEYVKRRLAGDKDLQYDQEELVSLTAENCTKSDLIELGRALFNCKIFSQATIDQVMKHIGAFFKKDLRNHYRIYLHMDNRKTKRTKFLDRLKDGFLGDIDDPE